MATFVENMNVKEIFYLFVGVFVNAVSGANFLYLINNPSSVDFQASKQTFPVSHTSGLVSSVLGLSTSKTFRWDGVSAGNPFHRPEAVGLVILEGFEDDTDEFDKTDQFFRYNIDKALYSVNLDTTFNELTNLFSNSDERPKLVNVETGEQWSEVATSSSAEKRIASAAKDRDYEFLDLKNDVDQNLLRQLFSIDSVMDELLRDKSKIRDGVADIYKFDVTSLKDYINKYKADHIKMDKTFTIIKQHLTKMGKTLETVYSPDDYLLLVMTVQKQLDSPHTDTLYRSKRQADTDNDDKDGGSDVAESDLNLSPSYDPNYPVTFNIILWTSVALVLALYAVSAMMWDMDPGRESIIYRMTSSRIKKE